MCLKIWIKIKTCSVVDLISVGVCVFCILMVVYQMCKYRALDSVLTGCIARNNKSKVQPDIFDAFSFSEYRLPENCRPIEYEVTITPNFDTGEFFSETRINVKVDEGADKIVINSFKLNILNVSIVRDFGATSDKPQIELKVKFELNSEFQMLTIQDEEKNNFETNERVQLHIFAIGQMNHKNVGLFQASRSEQGRPIIVTKLEPTYARQVFPCFDEPHLKALYQISVVKPKGEGAYNALSNFPEEKTQEIGNDLVKVTFQKTTIPMSTYLVALVISPFTKTTFTVRSKDDRLIPVTMHAPERDLHKTRIAGEFAVDILQHFEDYFNQPYPLPKLDMVAVPGFASLAMENWGLITFRRIALLNSQINTAKEKQRVAYIVAHEIAHSWFGNMVTLSWWDDLWLNEGFATFFSYYGINNLDKNWGMMDHFLIDEMHPALALDGTFYTHIVRRSVDSPDDISASFNAITYKKGASILRMIENVVSNTTFKKGIRKYLETYKFKNVISTGFFKSMEEVVNHGFNETLSQIMDTFTTQKFYPIINVTLLETNNTHDVFQLTQKLFQFHEFMIYEYVQYSYKWTIPVTYQTNLDKERKLIIFPHDKVSINVTVPKNRAWLKFNMEQVGFYRTTFHDIEYWTDLIDTYHSFSNLDRAHLIEETFSLAKAGLLNYKHPLNILAYLKNEVDYAPLAAFRTVIEDLLVYMYDCKQMKEYLAKDINQSFNKFGWKPTEEEKNMTVLARSEVLKIACMVGNEQCLENAHKDFQLWISNENYINEMSPEVAELVFRYGIANGSRLDWNTTYERYLLVDDAFVKLNYLRGLASSESQPLLNRLILYTENPNIIREADYFFTLERISENRVASYLVWNYVRDHWTNITERFTLNNRYLARMIPAITRNFISPVRLTDMKSFFTKYPSAGAGAITRDQALDRVRLNLNWIDKYQNQLAAWFDRHETARS